MKRRDRKFPPEYIRVGDGEPLKEGDVIWVGYITTVIKIGSSLYYQMRGAKYRVPIEHAKNYAVKVQKINSLCPVL